MRTIRMPDFAAALSVLVVMAPCAGADAFDKLKAKYATTSVNAEGGVVTQGVVLVLKKSGLVGGVNASCMNDYKDGKISMAGNLIKKGACSKAVGTVLKTVFSGAPDNTTRPFVAGEKVYVTKIEIKDGIIFSLISDAISDVRYKADLAFQRGKSLEPEPAEQVIAEVFKVEAGGAAPAARTAASEPVAQPAPVAAIAPAPVAPVEAFAPIAPPPPPPPSYPTSTARASSPRTTPLAPIQAPPDPSATAPIAPPPPPPDQPPARPAIFPGLTVDQVAALLGQPQKIADLGSKKVYSYGDLKVTFVSDRVTDVHEAANDVEPPPSTGGFRFSPTTIVLFVVGGGAGLSLLALGALFIAHSRRKKPVASAPPPPPPPPPFPSTSGQLPSPVVPSQRTEPTPWPPARAVSMPAAGREEEYKTLLNLGIISAEEYERESTKFASAAPAPPLPAAPTTIVLGQTADQVMGVLGQPTNIVDLGAKKIYVYPALKVTFNDGRVADVH